MRDQAAWSRLDDVAEVVSVSDRLEGPLLAQRLHGFDVVVANRERTRFDRELLGRLDTLRLLATNGMRNAAIDLKAAAELGIEVCGTDTLGHPTAELAWALILAWTRKLLEEAAAVRDGRWQSTLGRSLAGKVLGILGLGRIGSRMAVVGQAFGMDVIAHSRSLGPGEVAPCGATGASLHNLLASADVVSVHLPLNDHTRGLLDGAALSGMKPGSLLVNTARAEIVDQNALITALQEGPMAGAALDVFHDEPPSPGDPLRRLPNVLATPHLGYVVEDNYALAAEQTVDNIVGWLSGGERRTLTLKAGGTPQ
ncbi:MAG: D-2-hydroxyacid dehydrogenase family protein [Methylobacteriaceae bacterium]|nr:D-2-hydroxyacid dehydrogenase family protein [Methylobacteriaceae bacterium]